MTTQPQPTAALADAELIDSIEMDTGLSAGTIRDVLAALPNAGYRLARAESAPGVTVPVDTAKAARDGLGIAADHHARSEQARNELNRHWQILSDAIDAARADAGTEAE